MLIKKTTDWFSTRKFIDILSDFPHLTDVPHCRSAHRREEVVSDSVKAHLLS